MKTKALQWWVKNYESANDFSDCKKGVSMSVDINDVFPNLRSTEFEIEDGDYSFTDSEIEVFECEGLLIICDGHHRFNDAINNGSNRVNVVVVEKKVSNLFTGINIYKSLLIL